MEFLIILIEFFLPGVMAEVLQANTDWQGDHSSWKVMEFSKTIFQAWKVMENSRGREKSWKRMMMSWNFLYKCTRIFVSVNIILFVVGNWKYFYFGKHS